MKKITEIEIIDTEAWNNENYSGSFDSFERIYSDLEEKILKKLFNIYYDEDYLYVKELKDIEFHIMPFYGRALTYKGELIGTIKMILRPIEKDLHIIVEFNPFE